MLIKLNPAIKKDLTQNLIIGFLSLLSVILTTIFEKKSLPYQLSLFAYFCLPLVIVIKNYFIYYFYEYPKVEHLSLKTKAYSIGKKFLINFCLIVIPIIFFILLTNIFK